MYILEDDPELGPLLTRALREDDLAVRCAGSATVLVEMVDEAVPDALIVDIGLPDADGRDVVQALRARGIDVPIMFLTARDALADRLSGFAAGGDDYLVKPFAVAELLARLRAMLRRTVADRGVVVAGLRLDPAAHTATCGAVDVDLTPTEFRLLARLATNPGDAVRRRDLINAGWPAGAIVHDNTLDVFIRRLRRKLAPLPDAPTLVTVHGIGYSLR